jgi:hypothetical protein
MLILMLLVAASALAQTGVAGSGDRNSGSTTTVGSKQQKRVELIPNPLKGRPEVLPEECAKIAPLNELRHAVDTVSTRLISAIEDKDDKTVLELVRSRGQGLGFFNLGQQFVPHDMLESDFASKRGYYCRFFATGCWRNIENRKLWAAEESMRGHEYSYREWLTLSRPHKLNIEIVPTAYCQASIRILPVTAHSELPFFPTAMDWNWIHEEDGWKLLASGYTFVQLSSATHKEGSSAKHAAANGRACLFDFEMGEVPDCISKAANGELFITSKYVRELGFDSDGLAAVSPLDGTFMYVNRKGKALITGVPRFENGADFFHDGLVRIVRNGKYGFANIAGKVVIPPVYDGAMYFDKGRAQVCTGCVSKCAEPECEHHMFSGGEWTVIDTQGNRVE